MLGSVHTRPLPVSRVWASTDSPLSSGSVLALAQSTAAFPSAHPHGAGRTWQSGAMAVIPPVFMDCVVAIGVPSADGMKWIGTGFFYLKVQRREGPPEDEMAFGHAYLVTNKHVLEGRTEITVRCNPVAQEPGKHYKVVLLRSDGTELWIGHPDADIDVAVVPVDFLRLKAEAMQVWLFSSDTQAASSERMAQLGITEGDDVFVLGFPMAMVGEQRNVVMVRGGSIARMRDLLAGASKEFLIDVTVFPGNSGGPVVLKPHPFSIVGTPAQPSSYLLGIVAAYVPYRDYAISAQTNQVRIVFEENSGLAAVYPVDAIEGAIEQHLLALPAEPDPAEEPDAVPQGPDAISRALQIAVRRLQQNAEEQAKKEGTL